MNYFSHKTLLEWNNKTLDYFENHINSHHGEVTKAIYLIYIFFLHLKDGNLIHYKKDDKSYVVSNENHFFQIILSELSEDQDELMDYVENFQFNTLDKKEILNEVNKIVY